MSGGAAGVTVEQDGTGRLVGFRSARLVGRRLAPSDLDYIDRLHAAPDVMRFIGGVRDRATNEAWLAANLQHWADHGFGQWVLELEEVPIGRGGLRLLDADVLTQLVPSQADTVEPLIEVGYTFMTDAWGRGLATEATAAFVEVGRRCLGLNELCAVTLTGNDASTRVLEKNGFVLEHWVDHDWGRHKFLRWRASASPTVQ